MKVRPLQLYRLAVLAAAVWLIRGEVPAPSPEHSIPPPLEKVRLWFPAAASLAPAQPPRFAWPVHSDSGHLLGGILRTAPWTDALIGYAGPNDILIAESPDGTVLGLSVLGSGDTPGHTALVQQHSTFATSFTGWNPGTSSPPRVAAVSGATLTSLAMAEAVLQRLGGDPGSLRFPNAISPAEAKAIFPTTASFDGRTARDASHQVLGHLLRTAPSSDNVRGYAGPTETLLALEPDGRTIRTVRIRQSYDTPDYVDQIRDDPFYLRSFQGRTLDSLATLDYAKEGIEGVSGATQTSYAIAEGLKRRAAAARHRPPPPPGFSWNWHDTFLTAIILGALLMAFTPLRGKPAVRWIWQGLLIGYAGWVSASLLSLGLFTGWARHGPAWQAAPALVLLAATALLVPWATGRQIYCHQICPHGAAQLWLGRLSKKKVRIPPRLHRNLGRLPGFLLVLAFSAALGLIPLNNAHLEPFDAWSWRAAGLASLLLAAAGLLASCFIPQAYCHYGCPTGALLGWVRNPGSMDRFSRRDTLALLCLTTALLWTLLRTGPVVSDRSLASLPSHHDTSGRLGGRTMGTTWSLQIRHAVPSPPDLQQGVQTGLDRIENLLSTWRSDTPVSHFNAAQTTAPVPLPAEILTLIRHGQSLSSTTGGAYDLTSGPLVRAWGFGPPPRPAGPPTASELTTLREATGWEKLLLPPDAPPGTASRSHPGLNLDLNSLAEGYALDQTASWLHARGCHDFLLEIGGELCASGTWPVALDLPFQKLSLTNRSLATSGTYRQFHQTPSGRTTHLIDPRTGYPISHQTISVSVLAPDSLTADSWATALNILGLEAALPLATRLHLAARFVTEPSPGQLRITTSPAWTELQAGPPFFSARLE